MKTLKNKKFEIKEKSIQIFENYFEKNEEIDWDVLFLLRVNQEYILNLECFNTEEEILKNKVNNS
jgi:hypothetical protein